jgi:hypothetical protein
MAYTPADLERAHRYVKEGERRITDLEDDIDRQKCRGEPTEEAESVLAMMREIIWLLKEHAGDIELDLFERGGKEA